MREARCIRIFGTRKEAENACRILQKGGFECYVTEDKFGELTLEDLQIPPRFRLFVERVEINKIAEYLAKKMR